MCKGLWCSLVGLMAGSVLALAGEQSPPVKSLPAPPVSAPAAAPAAAPAPGMSGTVSVSKGAPVTVGEGKVISGPIVDSTHSEGRSRWGSDRSDGDESVWIRADYLMWWAKNNPLPVPVVTVGSPTDGIPGALGQPGTRTLIGNETIDVGGINGFRLAVGGWLDNERSVGMEFGYFFLGSNSGSRAATSSGAPGSPILAVPFRNALDGIEDVSYIADSTGLFPFGGTAILTATTEMQGYEFNSVFNVACTDGFRLSAIAGFRHLYLHESLTFATTSPTFPGVPGEVYATRDAFETYNHFYGGQLGAKAEFTTGNLYFDISGKLAIGGMRQILSTNGSLVTNSFFPLAVPLQEFRGGYLVQASNTGRVSSNDFAWVPELNMNLGYRLGQRAKLLFGYTLLGVSNVVRPGNQIDRNINPSQSANIAFTPTPVAVGPAAPTFKNDASGFWAQGLNFGLEFRF